PVLGFETISHQILCMPLVKLASRASTSARVLDERAALDVLRHDPIHRALVEHRALGCRIVAIETDRGIEPLVWRPKRRLKLLTGVELIFARSVDLLLANIDGLARHLLAHGFLLAEVGASQDAILDCGHLPYFRRRFAKGGYRAGGVDYLYSEFVYFDF
ncbi:MAG: hypothetical protein R3E87_26880, partial [Burkholderiaceae bacterium]